MATETLSAKITANITNFSNAMDKMSKDIKKVSDNFSGLNKLGDTMKNIGTKLTLGLTVPIAGVAAASTNTAMNFEAAMNEVSAISGATGKNLEKLSDLAKEMGRTTKFSATESAEALKFMSMAGWKTEDMLKALPGVLNLAAAGNTDLALTSDIVTDGLTGLGLSAKDTDKFVDIMAATCSNANTSIELMGDTLSYAGPVAGALGIEMSDLSLAIGLMGNAGIKGSQAGTALRAGLTNLVKPTKEMQAAMNKYGVEIVKTSDGSVDFMGTIQNLREKLGGLSETEQAAALASIFGKEAMSGWAAVVNASEGDFNKLNNAISNSNGTAQKMSDTMMKGAKGALTEMKSALEGVAITIGERLSPFVEKAADFISNLCAKFQELSPATQTLIMVISGVVAAIGPLLVIGGTLVKGFVLIQAATVALGGAFTALSFPVLGVIAAIALLVGGCIWLCQNLDFVKAKAKELGENISKYFTEMKDKALSKIEELKTNAINKYNEIKENISNKINELKTNVFNKFNEMKTNVSNKINELKTNAVNKFNEMKEGLSNKIQEAKQRVVDKFNQMKTEAQNKCENIINACKEKFDKAKQKFVEPIQNALNTIKNALTSFKPSWSIPKPKLPKIDVSMGNKSILGVNIPYPKFSVSWNAKGGIFRKPTIFNTPSGLQGVGEAGAEAIIPLKSFYNHLDDKLDSMGNGGINITVNANVNNDMDIRKLADDLAYHIKRKNIAIGR